MARKIEGITVEIGGDTTKLSKALESTNKQLKVTQTNLEDVDRLLKIDPKNTELLAQKQRLLSQAVEGTENKLETLKNAAEGAGEALRKGTIDQSQYDALQREIIETAQRIESFKAQQEALEKSMDGASDAVDEASGALEGLEDQQEQTENSTKTLSDGIGTLKDNAGKVADGVKGVAKAIGSLYGSAVLAVEGTEELRDGMSKLETTAKTLDLVVKDTLDSFRNFYLVSGDTASSAEAAANLANLGLEGQKLSDTVDMLSGAVIRFPDTLNIESLADSLQESVATGEVTGQFAELLGRLGVSVEEFGETFNWASSSATVESERLSRALGVLSAHGLDDVTTAWKEENEALISSRESQLELQESLADFAEAVTPLVVRVTDLATAFLDWFNGLSSGGQGAVAAIGAVVASMGPLLNILSGIKGLMGTGGLFGAGGLLGATGGAAAGGAAAGGTAAGGALATAAGIGGWITLILAAVGALTYLWETNEKFRASLVTFDEWITGIFTKDWSESFGAIGEVFEGLLANAKNLYESLKRVLGGLIDFVAGVFSGDWERAWSGVVEAFKGILDALTAILKAPINAIISHINALLVGVTDGINAMIGVLNSVKIDVPDWLPVLGGKTFSLNIPSITAPTIPYLEDGAVLPPNKPFLAMVGDQRNGTNIEAPMSTIKQGVREVLAEGGFSGNIARVEFTGSWSTFARALKPHVTLENDRAGSSLRR